MWFLVISLSTLHLQVKKLMPNSVDCILTLLTMQTINYLPWGDLHIWKQDYLQAYVTKCDDVHLTWPTPSVSNHKLILLSLSRRNLCTVIGQTNSAIPFSHPCNLPISLVSCSNSKGWVWPLEITCSIVYRCPYRRAGWWQLWGISKMIKFMVKFLAYIHV